MLCYNLFSWPSDGVNFILPSLTVLLYISSSGNCLLRPVHISLVELLFACTPKYSHCFFLRNDFCHSVRGSTQYLNHLVMAASQVFSQKQLQLSFLFIGECIQLNLHQLRRIFFSRITPRLTVSPIFTILWCGDVGIRNYFVWGVVVTHLAITFLPRLCAVAGSTPTIAKLEKKYQESKKLKFAGLVVPKRRNNEL